MSMEHNAEGFSVAISPSTKKYKKYEETKATGEVPGTAGEMVAKCHAA